MNNIFNDNYPIYLQIIDSVKKDIVSGRYQPGDKLLPVRDYAIKTMVNPNTVQKAFQELEKMKLVITESTNGRYITKDIKLIKKYRDEMASKLTNDYIKHMKELGFNSSEINQMIGGKDGISKN